MNRIAFADLPAGATFNAVGGEQIEAFRKVVGNEAQSIRDGRVFVQFKGDAPVVYLY